MKFMHDNSPIYTASTIGTWLEENDIPLVDWLPYSLEFNPVDQGWAELEERIYMLYLVLEKFDGTKKINYNATFTRRLKRAWKSLGYAYFNPLIASM